MRSDRRRFLGMSLAGAGALGLRALATGVPAGFFLAHRREAMAQATARPTALLLCVSRDGDPLNASAPGAFVPGVEHAPGEALAAAPVDLGGRVVQGARPWAELPADLRGRLAFVHHRTGTAAHTELESLLRLHGGMKGALGNGAEMLPSAYAAETFEALGTLQAEPLALGAERLTFEGRPLDNLRPTELKALFSGASAELDGLRALRDRTLDALYADLAARGTAAQRRYLDRFALGREQAVALGARLGALLERVPAAPEEPDGALDQLLAAAAVISLGITPALTVHVPLGGDNHDDAGLAREVEETVSGVGAIGFLWEELKALGLEDRVTFATLNTFGRTLKNKGGRGRDHNGEHHVMTLFGPRVRAGVIGGPVPAGQDFAASALDPVTGAARPDGAIAARDTLAAAARTLGAAVGIAPERLDVRVPAGRVIQAALV
jgi:hypothetical protein